jgi:CBS domain containing-hemolysin-like protein
MTILQIAAAAAFTMLIYDVWTREGVPGGLGGALVAITAALLFFGHGLPRALARQNLRATAAALAGFALVVTTIARPLVALYGFVTRRFARLLRRAPAATPEPAGGEGELHVLLNGGYGSELDGVIEEEEREMIDAILQLEERTARDIMVPRLDIVAVPQMAPLAEVVETIERAGHSRLPVYRDSIDSIAGVLYAKDLLRFVARTTAMPPLRSLLRPAYIVPESKRVDDLLKELRARKVHMAIVADEYGGTAGVVTIEDILEEIVGEIDDEYDVATAPAIEALGEGDVLVDGRIGADEVSEILGLGWAEEEHNTLGGLVQRELGRLPAPGEELDFGGARISVLSVDGHRIKQLRVEKLPSPSVNGAG